MILWFQAMAGVGALIAALATGSDVAWGAVLGFAICLGAGAVALAIENDR